MIWKVWQGTECMIPLSGHFPLFWKQLGRYELDWAVYREQTAQGDRTSPNLLQPTRSGWAGQCWLFIQGLRPRDSLLLLPLCLLTWKNWGRCICWLDLLPPLFCSLPVPCLASFFFFPTDFSTGGPLSPALRPLPPPPSSLHAFCCSVTYLDNHWCSKTGCTLSRGTGDAR